MNKSFSSNPTIGCDVNMSSSVSGQMICNNPSASVLFDGVIPTSFNTMCNKQLLRLRNDFTIIFNFGKTNFFPKLDVEVVFYNCPSRNTGAGAFLIRIRRSNVAGVGDSNGVHSCDHLIRICFSPTLELLTVFSLESLYPLADIYLAEIVFHNNTGGCNEGVSIVSSASSDSGCYTASTGNLVNIVFRTFNFPHNSVYNLPN